MSATNTSSTRSSGARRRRQTTSAAASPPAAAIAAQGMRSAGTGGGELVGGLTNSMSIRGPVTVAGGLPFPSVKASVNTKLPAPASGAASKLIPKTTEPPGAMEGSVQLYRLPWLVRANERSSELSRGPVGLVALSQAIPAAERV